MPAQHLRARSTGRCDQPHEPDGTAGASRHAHPCFRGTPPLTGMPDDGVCSTDGAAAFADAMDLQQLRGAAVSCGSPFSIPAPLRLPRDTTAISATRRGCLRASGVCHAGRQQHRTPLAGRRIGCTNGCQPTGFEANSGCRTEACMASSCVCHTSVTNFAEDSYLYDEARPATSGLAPFEWDLVRTLHAYACTMYLHPDRAQPRARSLLLAACGCTACVHSSSCTHTCSSTLRSRNLHPA